MNVIDFRGRLARWWFCILEFDNGICYVTDLVKSVKHFLTKGMSTISRGDGTTGEVVWSVPFFLVERDDLIDIPENDETVPTDTRVIDSILQLKYRRTLYFPRYCTTNMALSRAETDNFGKPALI